MMNVDCAYCEKQVCTGDVSNTPLFCPRRVEKEALENADDIRNKDTEVIKITSAAKSVEQEGYRIWPRVRELIEFSKRMGYKKIGIAFCTGLREETKQLSKILASHNFELSTVACTVNQGCNPVGQALVLNSQKTELNIIMGLCMGHDILFSNYSAAPVTTLVVKDRAMCHNPSAPLVNSYWKDTFIKDSNQ